jgi:hypothetical protein
MYEVYSGQRAGRPRAAIGAAAVVLIGCSALAASLAWSRALAPPVRVEGWAITFRPPRGWQWDGPQQEGPGTRMVYRESSERGGGRVLTFARYPNPKGLRSEQVCEILLGRRFGAVSYLFLRARIPREVQPLGPLHDARRVILQAQGLYLHVGTNTLKEGAAETYAMELQSAQPLELKDLRLCEALARGVEAAPE